MLMFVYGTLKRGGRLHHVLEEGKANFVGTAAIKADMYSLGWYPGIVEGEGSVSGEVFEVSPELRKQLDQIEVAYTAKNVEARVNQAEDMTVEAYFYNYLNDGHKKIESGIWEN